jgi:hypothetical protein
MKNKTQQATLNEAIAMTVRVIDILSENLCSAFID